MFMDWACPTNPRAQQAMAAFLITRGPYAFIGSRNLRDDLWDPLFALDVGQPTGLCTEIAKNVFARNWTKGTVSFDCNDYRAHLPFPTLADSEVFVVSNKPSPV